MHTEVQLINSSSSLTMCPWFPYDPLSVTVADSEWLWQGNAWIYCCTRTQPDDMWRKILPWDVLKDGVDYNIAKRTSARCNGRRVLHLTSLWFTTCIFHRSSRTSQLQRGWSQQTMRTCPAQHWQCRRSVSTFTKFWECSLTLFCLDSFYVGKLLGKIAYKITCHEVWRLMYTYTKQLLLSYKQVNCNNITTVFIKVTKIKMTFHDGEWLLASCVTQWEVNE